MRDLSPMTKKIVLQFDPAFIEEALFLKMRAEGGDPALTSSFHRDREQVYQEHQGDEERDRAFHRLHEDYFVRAGLREVFEKIFLEFPRFGKRDLLIFVKKVFFRKQEESELFVQREVKTVCIGLQAVRILDRPFLESFLYHEVMHISDMLDPAFQYSPHPDVGGESDIENHCIKERFRILWNFYVDSRLRRRGLPSFVPEEKYKENVREEVCHEILNGRPFTQADLLHLAHGKQGAL